MSGCLFKGLRTNKERALILNVLNHGWEDMCVLFGDRSD